MVNLQFGRGADQAWGKVGGVAPAPEPHGLVYLRFYPDLSGIGPPGAWRVELEDLCEGEAPVRFTGKWGEWGMIPTQRPYHSVTDTL